MSKYIKDISKEYANSNDLAKALGLEQDDPITAFEREPSVKLLRSIPKANQTREMVLRAIQSIDLTTRIGRHNRPALKYVSKRLYDEEICRIAVEKDWLNISLVPNRIITEKLCIIAIMSDSRAIKYIPKELQTKEIKSIVRKKRAEEKRILTQKMIEESKEIDFKEEYIEDGANDTFVVDHIPQALDIPIWKTDNDLAIAIEQPIVYDLASTDNTEVFYYVSDIHLEHQLPVLGKGMDEITDLIEEKVKELVASVSDRNGILLVGGDIASNRELVLLFYDLLSKYWNGKIVGVLGNHELWDNSGICENCNADDIISYYSDYLIGSCTLLENEVLIKYKNYHWKKITEKTILDADSNSLGQILENSSIIILGGVGFSGLNNSFNASNGIYRNTITIDEDIIRSKRFKAVYDKIIYCAGNTRVIVLTHMPKDDWSSEQYNSNWVYVNGHTHENSLEKELGGITVFADNQIGYKRKKWYLKGFELDRILFDPFKNYPDGKYNISPSQYEDFNYGRGINISSYKRSEDIVLLKRNNLYMFFAKGKNLYYLQGGRIRIAEHDLDYYYNNLISFSSNITKLFEPYYSTLKTISDEIIKIGGRGKIHGCIVDIDFLNHIYVNPFDGKITPYFATDMINKITYGSIRDMLDNSPIPPKLIASDENNSLIVIADNQISNHAIVPAIVLDTKMYEPSRIMRSIQYLIDNNVIRTWNDSLC